MKIIQHKLSTTGRRLRSTLAELKNNKQVEKKKGDPFLFGKNKRAKNQLYTQATVPKLEARTRRKKKVNNFNSDDEKCRAESEVLSDRFGRDYLPRSSKPFQGQIWEGISQIQ